MDAVSLFSFAVIKMFFMLDESINPARAPFVLPAEHLGETSVRFLMVAEDTHPNNPENSLPVGILVIFNPEIEYPLPSKLPEKGKETVDPEDVTLFPIGIKLFDNEMLEFSLK